MHWGKKRISNNLHIFCPLKTPNQCHIKICNLTHSFESRGCLLPFPFRSIHFGIFGSSERTVHSGSIPVGRTHFNKEAVSFLFSPSIILKNYIVYIIHNFVVSLHHNHRPDSVDLLKKLASNKFFSRNVSSYKEC